MEPKSPDISEISLLEMQNRPFPITDDFRIGISVQAYKTIQQHGKEDRTIEICGVLIGDIYKDDHGPYLEIMAAIRGEHAASQEGQVMFTQDTWAHIHDIKDSQFPDQRIVGWYHTHPNYGVFLSPQDMFIHKNFFNQPWQVAYVVDPVSLEEGFFVWEDGSPYQVKKFWVGGKKKTITEGSPKQEQEVKEIYAGELMHSRGKRLWPFFLIPLLLLLFLLMIFSFFILNNKSNKIVSSLDKNFSNIEVVLHQLQSSPTDTSSKIAEIKKAIDKANISNSELTINQKGNHIWINGEVYTYNHKEKLGKSIAGVPGVESVDLQGVIVTQKYTVGTGESLSEIAEKVYGNPFRWRDIYQSNKDRIKNPDRVQAFTTIILP